MWGGLPEGVEIALRSTYMLAFAASRVTYFVTRTARR